MAACFAIKLFLHAYIDAYACGGIYDRRPCSTASSSSTSCCRFSSSTGFCSMWLIPSSLWPRPFHIKTAASPSFSYLYASWLRRSAPCHNRVPLVQMLHFLLAVGTSQMTLFSCFFEDILAIFLWLCCLHSYTRFSQHRTAQARLVRP